MTGEEIPLAARIIMVSDTVDAMLSHRPYRSALDTGGVKTELLRYSGRQFDPGIVTVFLENGLLEKAAQNAEDDLAEWEERLRTAPVVGGSERLSAG